MDPTILIITLIILTIASAYYSSSETALFSLSPMKIKTYEYSPDPRKRLIAKLILQPRDLLVTVFILNTLVNILLQNVASHMFGKEAGWDLKVGIPFLLTLIFGEIIPKNFGIQHNAALSYYVVPSINFAHRLLAPIRRWTIAVTQPISRLMFFYLQKEENISKGELEHVLRTSEERGILNKEEAVLVYGYLELQDSLVKEIMRPREDIIFYDINEPLSKLIHLFVDQQVTRLPVVDKTVDNTIGMLTVREFFLNRHKITEPEHVHRLLVKPFYIPENSPARALLKKFDEAGQEIAIAVDEYGAISGLITREDLIEEVVGEIEDKRDQKILYTRSGPNEIISSSKLEIDEFNQIFDVNFDSESNMVTIGGWLIEQLGTIPKSGTQHQAEGFLFQILAADPNRIRRLYIRKLKKDKPNRIGGAE